jgi:hypothetical protein
LSRKLIIGVVFVAFVSILLAQAGTDVNMAKSSADR